jgi:hypothetical protein
MGLTAAQWREETVERSARAGRILADWQVAELIIAENHARADADAAAYMAKVEAVYQPLVADIKAGTPRRVWKQEKDWLIERINEHRAKRGLGPVDDVEDWRVAWEVHPIKFDNDGNPRGPIPKPKPRRTASRTKAASATN